MPSFCPERIELEGGDEIESDAPAVKENAKGKNWKPDLASWILAFDRYALAAAMLEQLPFVLLQTYKQIVVEVAVTARSEGRSTLLGAFYDELLRLVFPFVLLV